MIFLKILLFIAMAATVIVLGLGIFTMLKSSGQDVSQKTANTYMRWRVILQVFSLFIFTVLLLCYKSKA